MKHIPIQKALEQLSNTGLDQELTLESPTHQHIAHALFTIANSPNPKVRGARARATRAQRLILDRMVGLRKPGSHPAQLKNDEIQFVNLTVPEIGEPSDTEDADDHGS